MADLLVPSRRRFLLGAGATLLTAPAIVRVASLMPVSVVDAAAPAAIDWGTGSVTISTHARHGVIAVGQTITISGTSEAYNGTWVVTGAGNGGTIARRPAPVLSRMVPLSLLPI